MRDERQRVSPATRISPARARRFGRSRTPGRLTLKPLGEPARRFVSVSVSTAVSVAIAIVLGVVGVGERRATAADPPVVDLRAKSTFVFSIKGLFCPEREQDLRELVERSLPKIKLLAVDFPTAEATFEFVPAEAFPGTGAAQIVERLNQELGGASRWTFGAKPPRTTPLDKLQRIEMPIYGLDCKACSLAVYEMVLNLKGAELVQASFRDRKLTVLADPEQLKASDIEKLLEQRGVAIKPPAP